MDTNGGSIYPRLESIVKQLNQIIDEEGCNLIPLLKTLPQEVYTKETPISAFLKICNSANSGEKGKDADRGLIPCSFLLETAEIKKSDAIGKHRMLMSVIGTEPFQTMKTFEKDGDPLLLLEEKMKNFRSSKRFFNELKAKESLYPLDLVNGGAIGYVGYDCVRFFENKKLKPFYNGMKDELSLPESFFMFCNMMVIFDHVSHNIQIISLCKLDKDTVVLEENYRMAISCIEELENRLMKGQLAHLEGESVRDGGTSNFGREGYEDMVVKLKERIVDGDIIQAVPSHRITRNIGNLHPFRVYEELRTLNPSRYMFYMDVENQFQLVGASPELLVKVDLDGRVINHPIAGTRRRGQTIEEDLQLEAELLADPKERAEHIMLVDLGRNDVNRVSEPRSTRVESLMHVERYSHVMHIVSEVCGTLRGGCSIYDAFRSIFPAGTVSGAPKIKAMELIASLERVKRGVYAGAVGYFSFAGSVDTCIALRTMVIKDRKAYLQAGGGIVFDSQPYDEYIETVNKMAAAAKAIDAAEDTYSRHPSTRVEASKDFQGTDAIETYNRIFRGHFASLPTAVPAAVTAPPSKGNKLLLIDNYDSFTWNLYQYLCQLGQDVIVLRNDEATVDYCLSLPVDRLVISPGPSWPKDAGISNDILRAFAGKLPVLGVCLGHECMVEVFGGTIKHCGEIVHGKASSIKHDGKGVYENVPQDVQVIRYHSLAAEVKSLEHASIVATSWTESGVIMGVRHRRYKMEGVQFHPESILSEGGMEMLKNFTKWTGGEWDKEC